MSGTDDVAVRKGSVHDRQGRASLTAVHLPLGGEGSYLRVNRLPEIVFRLISEQERNLKCFS